MMGCVGAQTRCVAAPGRKIDPKTKHRRNLGTFKTKSAAEKHERAVQYCERPRSVRRLRAWAALRVWDIFGLKP
jgi:hypothetical protein